MAYEVEKVGHKIHELKMFLFLNYWRAFGNNPPAGESLLYA